MHHLFPKSTHADTDQKFDIKLVSQEKKRGWIIFWILVFLLITSSLGYAWLHSWVSQNKLKNSLASQEIIDAEKQINEVINSINNTVTHDSIKQNLKNIEKGLDSITQKTNSEIATLKLFVNSINSQIQESEVTLSEELQTYIKTLLLSVQAQLRQEINQENNSFFWQDKPWLWLEIAFWGWIGTIFYLLSEFYTYYQKDEQEQRFRDLTPWYFITLFRGTFVVFLILLGTTSINLNFGTATSLDFSQIPVEAYVFLSGVLGYFNRAAKEQLKFMVKAIFPGAWSAANKLLISPCSQTLDYGQHTKFSINSLEPVQWTIHPENSGKIIPQTGFEVSYIAPSLKDTPEREIKQVTIVASLISNPHQTAVAIVTFKKTISPMVSSDSTPALLNLGEQHNLDEQTSDTN